MQYVCDGPSNKTWFRIETEAEAVLEARAMNHAVDKHFKMSYEQAAKSYVPPKTAAAFERSIGLKDHIKRVMPIFLTLRDREGKAHVTAMLPPGGRDDRNFRPIIVGPGNSDPYPQNVDDIRKLGQHYGLALDPARCFPYKRG